MTNIKNVCEFCIKVETAKRNGNETL